MHRVKHDQSWKCLKLIETGKVKLLPDACNSSSHSIRQSEPPIWYPMSRHRYQEHPHHLRRRISKLLRATGYSLYWPRWNRRDQGGRGRRRRRVCESWWWATAFWLVGVGDSEIERERGEIYPVRVILSRLSWLTWGGAHELRVWLHLGHTRYCWSWEFWLGCDGGWGWDRWGRQPLIHVASWP